MYRFYGLILIQSILLTAPSYSQELYVYNEPASTLPARSISLKVKNHFAQQTALLNQFSFRTVPQVFLGVDKNVTIR